MRRRETARITGLALASLVLLVAPASGEAATVQLGKIAPLGITGGCSGCSFFQRTTNPASASYTVPAGGPWTITSWSARGGTVDDGARLLVFRATGAANEFRLVATSATAPIPANGAPVIAESIPVQPGDQLGLRTNGGAGDMPSRYPTAFAEDGIANVMGNLLLNETVGPAGDHFYGVDASVAVNLSADLSAPDPVVPAKKCKKKKKRKKKHPAAKAKKKKKKKCRKRKRKKKKG